MMNASTDRAFTLIELLCVLGIMGLLVTLLFPTVGVMMERANNTKCVNNLKQLATTAHLYANDHDNRFPVIEADPDSPVHPPDANAQPMDVAFAPYGITDAARQCPADLKGPNWFAKKKTSYMWLPYSEDEEQQAVTMYMPRGAFPAKLSRVRLCQDWDTVHPADYPGGIMRMNVAFADGHVSAGNRGAR
jgi:prepilin-type N-terminal cleavage/methylation domain-containing protein/prepilin-type processing-associated H-X9-DG protein